MTSGWRIPGSLRTLLESLEPRGIALFKGKIDPEGMGPLERTVIRKVGAPTGDFRDWKEVEAWALSIARELRARG